MNLNKLLLRYNKKLNIVTTTHSKVSCLASSNTNYGNHVSTDGLISLASKDMKQCQVDDDYRLIEDMDYKLIDDMDNKLKDVRDPESQSHWSNNTKDLADTMRTFGKEDTFRTYGPGRENLNLSRELIGSATSRGIIEPFLVPFWKMGSKLIFVETLKFLRFGFSMALNSSVNIIITFIC